MQPLSLLMITLCILNSDTDGAEEKDEISSGPGEPPDLYPLELPDSRVLAFDLKRMGRDSEETKKQQCQVEASPITVEFGVGGAYQHPSLNVLCVSAASRTAQHNILHTVQHVCDFLRDPRAGEGHGDVYVQVLFEDSGSREARESDHVRDAEADEEAKEQGRGRRDARPELPVHGDPADQLIHQVDGVQRYTGRSKASRHRVRVQEP